MLSRRLLRIKVIKAVYAHLKSESDSPAASERGLVASVDRTYDLYHQVLWLAVEVKRHAEHRIEMARRKRLPTREDLEPNTRLVDNAAIAQIEHSDALGRWFEGRGVVWTRHPELVKSLFNSLAESEYYQKYMSAPEVDHRDDVKLLTDFFVETVQDNPALEEAIEEESVMWADDLDFALIMVVRTLDMFRRGQKDVPLMPQFKSGDDEEFYRALFARTMAGYAASTEYIDRFTRNWDLDRLAFMDNVIMSVAIAELMHFPSIPVKVTLDEYIEIAKYYSTPGSGLFINGVLDKVIDTLRSEGKIEKTGRGLL